MNDIQLDLDLYSWNYVSSIFVFLVDIEKLDNYLLGFTKLGGIMNHIPEELLAVLGELESPTLLMQTEPRQVVTANKKACELFDKNLAQIEGHRGGQVFDCIHSFTEKGCGLDPNCEDCKIKNAVVDTFLSGESQENIQTILDIKSHNIITPYVVKVSTKKVGDFALITIDNMYTINA